MSIMRENHDRIEELEDRVADLETEVERRDAPPWYVRLLSGGER